MDAKDRLKEFRTRKGFTQSEMADRLGITQAAYSDMERGRTNVGFNKLKTAFPDIDIEYIMNGKKKPEQVQASEVDNLRQEIERLKNDLAIRDKLIAALEQLVNKGK